MSLKNKRGLNRREFLKAGVGGIGILGFGRFFGDTAFGYSDRLYDEKYRPQFHFSPMKNWTNDPNGLVYYKGEYHLFFQHNPFGINWGNMTWGHAVSRDLMHWKQLPNAIEPDELGTIYSGSAVVDWNNTAGFKTGSEDVLVAFYTSAGEHAKPVEQPYTQSIAYSNNRGRTWIKYKDNPIVGNINNDDERDPKVFWHEGSGYWVMVLFLDSDDQFAILRSKDLKSWEITQKLVMGDSRECPDMFELAVEGEDLKKWVFWGGDSGYQVGSFDGKKFTAEQERCQAAVGQYYAAQSYSDIPASDGRRIQISWMRNGKFPGMPFNQQMSIPCELKLRRFGDDLRLCLTPVKEVEKVREFGYSHGPAVVGEGGVNMLADVKSELLEVQAEIRPMDAKQFGFVLRGNELLYDVDSGKIKCCDLEASVKPADGVIKLHILVDRASIEVFINDGERSIFKCFPLDTENLSLGFFARGGKVKLEKIKVWQLRSVWR
jgi:sucrose-6-phosphate hydrolase SacC (GH32 family)